MEQEKFEFLIEEAFQVSKESLAICGTVKHGHIKNGDVVEIPNVGQHRIESIEMYRKKLDYIESGDNAALFFSNLSKDNIISGEYITSISNPLNTIDDEVENSSQESKKTIAQKLHCYNCGEEINKSFKHCPYCGTELNIQNNEVVISDNNEEKASSKANINMRLGTHTITVDKLWDGYNQVRKFFWNRASERAEKFWGEYWKCKGIDVASKVFGECINEILEDNIQCVSNILFETGMTDINMDRLATNYQTNYIDLEYMLKPLVDKMLAIQELQGDMELQSTIKKMCRPQWQGGGVGLGGAIAGAVTSVALNAATSGLFAIGDFFKNNANNSKINKLKTILYNEPDTIISMIDTIMDCYSQGFYLWRDEMELRGMLPEIRFDTEKSMALYQNAMNLAKTKEQKQDMLIQSVITAPYIYMQYRPLYEEFPDTIGLDNFAEYFGVKQPYNIQIFIENQLTLKKIDGLAEKTLDDLLTKLKKYIEFDELHNIDIGERIKDYPQKISLVCRGKVDNIDRAINYLSDSVIAYEYEEFINSIISCLKNEKKDIIKLNERNRLEKMPELKASEIARKINAYAKYGTENKTNESKKIEVLLSKLVDKMKSEEDLLDVENEIKTIAETVHPRVKYIKDAIKLKKQLYRYKAQAEGYGKYIFLPEIFEIINEARKGNPFFQLWVKNMLASSKLINTVKKGLADADDAERRICKELSETLPECIAYLFDKPEEYSFDLFMRMKVNYIWMDRDEYIEILEQFKDDTSCPAGMYEYGIQLYLKDESDKKAVEAIKLAADNGYYDAYSFMRKHCKEIGAEPELEMYYNILIQHSYLYKISSNEVDISFSIDTLRQIEKLLNGKASSSVGIASLLQYIFEYWNGHRYADSKTEHYGLPNDDPVCRKNLKTVLKYIGFNLEGEVLFSYENTQDKKSPKYLLITSKALYWNNGNGIMKSLYNDSNIIDVWKEKLGFTLGFHHQAFDIYYIVYHNSKAYKKNLCIDELERMAYCGHPLAICNLMVNSEYKASETRKEKWAELRKQWLANGKFYGVCPVCYEQCTEEDAYCPECGTKIY